MDLGERLMEALKFDTVFTMDIAGVKLPITETVVVSWAAMAVLILGSYLLTRKMKEIPDGPQAILESAVEFLNSFSKEQFGNHWVGYAPYIGTVFLFLSASNLIPLISPLGGFGFEPAFTIKPPTRDINVTAALSIISIGVVIVSGFRVRGFRGWFKHLAHPVPMMVPFNLLEYFIRPTALCLRLFGNVLGAFIIMRLIEAVAPIGVPPVIALYFDILDGLIQATVFTFLTMVFVAEAIE